MGIQAFSPMGNTVTFLAAPSPPTAVQGVSSTGGANQYLIQNAGSTIVMLGVGSTAALAATNAANVTSSGASIPLLPYTTQVFSFIPGAYFTGYCGATAQVYVTPGDGL